MNFKENVLKVFRGEEPDQVVWQPRIENWYDVQKRQGTLPEKYEGMSLLEVYDELECSPRPYLYGRPSPEDLSDWEGIERAGGGYCPQEVPPVWTVTLDGGNIITEQEIEGEDLIERWKSPKGNLTRKWRTSDLSIVPHVVEHPVKEVEQLEVMEYILRHQKVDFNYDNYEFVKEKIGDRAPLAINVPRAPFQQLILFYMGYEKGILALYKRTEEVELFLESAEEIDDRFYEMVKDCPIDIVNFPDNVDGHFDTPPLLEKYLLPHWQKRTEELRDAGKFTDVHWDGSVKPILDYTHDLGVDGFEALTPKPQGDVTIKEMSDALGDDLVLLDGIPATHFMPNFSEEELKNTVKKLIEEFAPNLILGISDEIPANGDIEKVRLVSQWVQEYNRGKSI